jgi:AcrR family transcriptional regulator
MENASESSRYDSQKQLAIRSAASVFAEKGFHGASTKDIAERMGIKQGSITTSSPRKKRWLKFASSASKIM